MIRYPSKIENESQLEDLLSIPIPEVVASFSKQEGDLIVLGVGGKIGPSLARMAKRACEKTGLNRRIIGVSLFDSEEIRSVLEKAGIETIHGDLLDWEFLQSLPSVKNVIYMAGMKFGSTENLPLTWATNSYLPAKVAEKYRNSKIVAFSTGCVYPLVPAQSGGSVESDPPEPIGEYAQSCLGRERMFEFFSKKYKTPVALIRLNYAVEMRYGVLVDIALKVNNNLPVDLTMGFVNVIWQGDVNAMVLRSLDICETPAKILNITGPETLSVRQLAQRFGELFKRKPNFIGQESDTALLSNASLSHRLFGNPQVSSEKMIHWTADWIKNKRRLLDKPTHFEVKDGKY
ncbi:MAG: NAD-dependent epimerase/dehydratase family protein [Candidatus Aenigmarchaeota archaeon]|nr:NAD-dependent epimerase/dehydratase family protein [Candidatus Aenigmarchaeota archaeon]